MTQKRADGRTFFLCGLIKGIGFHLERRRLIQNGRQRQLSRTKAVIKGFQQTLMAVLTSHDFVA
jgi:hypothetical protein